MNQINSRNDFDHGDSTINIVVVIIIITFKPTSTSHMQENYKLDIHNSNGCNGDLLCDHGVVERNRISSLR